MNKFVTGIHVHTNMLAEDRLCNCTSGHNHADISFLLSSCILEHQNAEGTVSF